MRSWLFVVGVCLGLGSLAAPSDAAALIQANVSTAASLGIYGPGQYQLSGSGIVDLVGDGVSFLMNPDGTPNVPVTHPGYPYFNPDGSYIADGNYGPGGAGVKIGALMYSLDNGASWLTIGYSAIVNLGSATNILAMVNDTYYSNNQGAFSVEVSAVPVPPAVLLFGSALVGAGLLRRRKAAA